MRKSLVLATLVVLACTASTAFAGIPDPTRSGCSLNAQPLACQWRFRADGLLDRMTLKLTLRDVFDAPVANCSTWVNLSNFSFPSGTTGQCPGGVAGNRKAGKTNASGVIHFGFRCIGGRGSVELRVTSFCGTKIPICNPAILYTNPDLDGSNQASPTSTNVVDLGLWSGCLPPSPYCVTSDYDCSGSVNVVDLGLWAGGLNKGCSLCP